jgi:molybdenum cofactor sulfurtransferase
MLTKSQTDKVYLDHAGTTVYAKSLIETFSGKMIDNLYGNPHSASAPAKLSGEVVDSVREKTLAFFNADPKHFDLIFTGEFLSKIFISFAETVHTVHERKRLTS